MLRRNQFSGAADQRGREEDADDHGLHRGGFAAGCAANWLVSEDATARGAIVEGNVRCERRCSIQDFRIAAEIVPETLNAVTNLFGELHRQFHLIRSHLSCRHF